MPRHPRRVDEAQIEHIFKTGRARVRAYREVVVIDDLELRELPAKSTAKCNTRMHLSWGTRIRHFAEVRLKQDVFSYWHRGDARCTHHIAPTTFMKMPWLLKLISVRSSEKLVKLYPSPAFTCLPRWR